MPQLMIGDTETSEDLSPIETLFENSPVVTTFDGVNIPITEGVKVKFPNGIGGHTFEIVEVLDDAGTPPIKHYNRAGRTLIDTGKGLYLVDHTDNEGIDTRTGNQEGFQCVAKVDTKGLNKNEIETLKKELTNEVIRNKTGISGVLKSHGYSKRLQNSDSIDAEDRRSNANYVGLDQQASQGESRRGQSYQNSQENLGTGQVRTGFDGTNNPRYTDIEGMPQFMIGDTETSEVSIPASYGNDNSRG